MDLEGRWLLPLLCSLFTIFLTDMVRRFSLPDIYIEERSFRRFVEACLEETIVVYVDHLLTQKSYIREETIERMRLDEEVLMDFFREHINATKVENRVRILADLRDLASAESLDSFTLVYTNILEHQPDCPPEVVEKLVALREGIPRKEAKEVVQECKEIYANSLVVAHVGKVNVRNYISRPTSKDFIQVEIVVEKDSQKMILIVLHCKMSK